MFVLGIDPGLTRTGYGILETRGSRSRAVVAGVIRTDPAAGIAQRLAELYHDLREIVAEHDIAEAAIEEVFVNRNLHTAMALCGYGSADKEQVQKVVAMRLELPQAPKPADAADALAIALCHVQALPMRRAVERAG